MEHEAIIAAADAVYDEVKALRRRLHQRPERSFAEHATAGEITRLLRAAGIECRPVAGTGVLARIEGCGELSRAVVLRADIDALPLHEASGEECASRNEGLMHACGHDLHAAVLYGALRILQQHRAAFEGTLFGLFQPGEECNPGGASLVLAEEPFARYRVEAVIGEHVDPELPTGVFGFREGRYMASSDELRFTVRGRGGHAALRHLLRDPIAAAAQLLTALRTLGDESSPAVLSIGRIEADGTTNVIPDTVRLEGTLRAFEERHRALLHERIAGTAATIARSAGVEIDTDISRGYPCVTNDAALTRLARRTAASMWGPGRIAELPLRPTAEDFGFYSQRYPSLFYRLGAGAQAADPTDHSPHDAGRLHHPAFRPNERAMRYGVAQMAALALEVMKQVKK